jgi:hypothetical protein
MGGRTTYWTCHLKGHLFKKGLTDDPTCERCLEEDESATYILCDCEAIANLRFRHLGQFFTEPSDYYVTDHYLPASFSNIIRLNINFNIWDLLPVLN